MATSFEMQAAVAVREVNQLKVPLLLSKRLGLKLVPEKAVDEVTITYERRRLYTGLLAPRSQGGPAGRHQLPASDSFTANPGRYGGFVEFLEKDLEGRRQVGSWTEFDENGKLTDRASQFLLQLEYDRMEKNIWDLLQTGGYEVVGDDGRVYMQDAYNIPTATYGSGGAWTYANAANATPLKDLRDTIATLELGLSVDFTNGTMYMSRPTFNNMIANSNSADLGKTRLTYGETVNAVGALNKLLIENGLPTVELYDESYYPSGSTTQSQAVRFLTAGKIVITGKRMDGEPMGEYRLTRSANNGGKPGHFTIVKDERDKVPAKITVTQGHNGGPTLYYPEAVCAFTAY